MEDGVLLRTANGEGPNTFNSCSGVLLIGNSYITCKIMQAIRIPGSCKISLEILFGRYQNINEDHRTNPCFHGEGELPTSFWCSCDGQSSHWCGACDFSGAWGAVFAGRHDLQQCLCQLGALVVHPPVQHTPQQFNINMNLHTLCIHLYAHVCVWCLHFYTANYFHVLVHRCLSGSLTKNELLVSSNRVCKHLNMYVFVFKVRKHICIGMCA